MSTPPAAPNAGETIAVERWEIVLKKYEEQTETFTDFLANLFCVMIRQCTEVLVDKIKLHVDSARANQDRIKLLQHNQTVDVFF